MLRPYIPLEKKVALTCANLFYGRNVANRHGSSNDSIGKLICSIFFWPNWFDCSDDMGKLSSAARLFFVYKIKLGRLTCHLLKGHHGLSNNGVAVEFSTHPLQIYVQVELAHSRYYGLIQ